jgi:hypothetical protein
LAKAEKVVGWPDREPKGQSDRYGYGFGRLDLYVHGRVR